MKKHATTVTLMIFAGMVGYWWGDSSAKSPNAPVSAPTIQATDSAAVAQSSIADVLQLAADAKTTMSTNLHDYTARFVKQERSDDGVLGELNEMELKIQTRMRNDSDDAPMRIYLKFISPQSAAGREVMWCKDKYDGQMAVHETAFLLNLKTIWLEPTGIIAMTGQKFPIYEIGLVRLVEQLIERGQKDLDNPDVSVVMSKGHEFDGIQAELIRVRRSKPSGDKDDFKLAEIVFDRERMLILSYRSFGWPEQADADVPDSELPLLESYAYHDIKTNVGLTDDDFDVNNEAYGFP
ncbi:DUF1571 domain-containing protein [Stieleria varia]|uniref:DUF1571 domain-containing protein n=1 Tax=Stieleria varia TaxID=2528005 RepID=A0A5C6A1J2_9BACT|nr:DUF1571 domain-containing protein [Stieleria varia]TWT93286.1 hypothetical protein Pla52n_59460 [Stieleria varia]